METLTDTWRDLRHAPHGVSHGGFRMRLLEANAGVRVFAAVADDNGAAAMLVELPLRERPRDLVRMSTRAFDAFVSDFDGLTNGCVGVAVVLRDSAFEDLFTVLAADLRRAVSASLSATDASDGLARVIDRWRRFIDHGRGFLSAESVRGLIGELVVLARAVSKYGHRAALTGWTGPQDALRDFQLPSVSVEVKTYQSDTGASVRINDPQQLDDVPSRPVYLAALQLASVESRGMTLAEYASAVAELVKSDPDARELYEARLADCGFLMTHADRYPERYVVESMKLYLVQSGFPRIRVADIPVGVHDVHFSIELAALSGHAVDSASILGDPVLSVERC